MIDIFKLFDEARNTNHPLLVTILYMEEYAARERERLKGGERR